jgi:hypothetical protein
MMFKFDKKTKWNIMPRNEIENNLNKKSTKRKTNSNKKEWWPKSIEIKIGRHN